MLIRHVSLFLMSLLFASLEADISLKKSPQQSWIEANKENITNMKSYVVKKIGWNELKEKLSKDIKKDDQHIRIHRIQISDGTCPKSALATNYDKSIEFELTKRPLRSHNDNNTKDDHKNKDLDLVIMDKENGQKPKWNKQKLSNLNSQKKSSICENLSKEGEFHENYNRNEGKVKLWQGTLGTERSNESQLLDKALLRRKFKEHQNGFYSKKTLVATTGKYQEGINGAEEEEQMELINPADVGDDSGYSDRLNYRYCKKCNSKLCKRKNKVIDESAKVDYRRYRKCKHNELVDREKTLQNKKYSSDIALPEPLPVHIRVHARKKNPNAQLQSAEGRNPKSKGKDVLEENTEIIENDGENLPDSTKETRVQQSLNFVIRAPFENESPDVEHGHKADVIDSDHLNMNIEYRNLPKSNTAAQYDDMRKEQVKEVTRKFTSSDRTANLRQISPYLINHRSHASFSRERRIHNKDSKKSGSSVAYLSAENKKNILKRPQLAKLIDLVDNLPEGVIIIKPRKQVTTNAPNDDTLGNTYVKQSVSDESYGVPSGKSKAHVTTTEISEHVEDLNTGLIRRGPYKERKYNMERIDKENDINNRGDYYPHNVRNIKDYYTVS